MIEYPKAKVCAAHVAPIAISRSLESKKFHDIVGYYNRFDIFELEVTRKRLTPISFPGTVTKALFSHHRQGQSRTDRPWLA
jgi:hypothetical protein